MLQNLAKPKIPLKMASGHKPTTLLRPGGIEQSSALNGPSRSSLNLAAGRVGEKAKTPLGFNKDGELPKP